MAFLRGWRRRRNIDDTVDVDATGVAMANAASLAAMVRTPRTMS
jgi:hypothetical protein